MIRFFDICGAVIGIIISVPIAFFVAVKNAQRFGSIFFVQKRIGRNGLLFSMIKFRSMDPNVPIMPSHLLPPDAIDDWGMFLRRKKIDELPQLLNVLTGEMSLVGPRPCLPSQSDLIEARRDSGLLDIRPGLTGPAQIKGIDMSDTDKLIAEELVFVTNFSAIDYVCCIVNTIFTLWVKIHR